MAGDILQPAAAKTSLHTPPIFPDFPRNFDSAFRKSLTALGFSKSVRAEGFCFGYMEDLSDAARLH